MNNFSVPACDKAVHKATECTAG